ncbi:hypothetical protein KPL70_022536 [Citrus sinensis]|nr:hypothetical protein KPL70_022536 [Citrus sinensis]
MIIFKILPKLCKLQLISLLFKAVATIPLLAVVDRKGVLGEGWKPIEDPKEPHGETEVVSDTNYRRILVVKDGTSTIVEAYISPVAGKYVDSETSQQSEQHGIFSGQVMTAVKDACRQAVLKKKPRLVEAMRAQVLKEGMQEGSALFTVHAYLPVSESFGFADELRKETSGAASALLALSQFEAVFCDILTGDPFCVK